jgi:hypothetical protein
VAQGAEYEAGKEIGERRQCQLAERACEEWEAAGEGQRSPELYEDGGRHHILCNSLGAPGPQRAHFAGKAGSLVHTVVSWSPPYLTQTNGRVQ